MKTTDLLGKTVEWKIKGYVAGDGHRTNSGLHNLARTVIRSVYPTVQFKEEVPIPTGKGNLILDFYMPVHQLAVEVQGQQHYEFSLHYHQTRANFLLHKQRDAHKAEWCEINGINLVILPYNEDENEWKRRLCRASHGEDAEGSKAAG